MRFIINLEKAYDTVRIVKLWEESNINYTLINALKNLYDDSRSRNRKIVYRYIFHYQKDYVKDTVYRQCSSRFMYLRV